MLFLTIFSLHPRLQPDKSILNVRFFPNSVTTSDMTAALRTIFKPGFKYAKADVMPTDLQRDNQSQGELDLEDDEAPDHSKLMAILDGLN